MDDILRNKIGSVFSELARVGDYLVEHGHFERALRVFMTLSDGDPTFEAGSYAYSIGICYESMGERSMAKKYFDIAARENPHMKRYIDAANKYETDSYEPKN